MITIQEMISTHKFFHDLKPEYLRLIADCATNVTVNAEEYLFHAGEAADQFYVIRHGMVAIEIYDHRRGAVRIQTLLEDDVLGWSWLFPPYKWHYDAHALTLVRMTAFDGKCLREKCEADHDLGYELMKRFAGILVDRLQATRLQVMNVYG
ncbi:MAG: cyclic nucleotide-binding domain-containing protein [Anaerolineae bacterium]|nr:cyclic nucleotide-binding domain-containing protein [Anaerolineae bacterium]